MLHEVLASFGEALLLGRVQEVPRTIMQNILAVEGVGVSFIARILYERYCTHTTSSVWKPLLFLTIVQSKYFANGFLQNVLQT
jgi:hypothetical protein